MFNEVKMLGDKTTHSEVMTPIRLPCLLGGECKFLTVELDYEKAKHQLDGHMQYAHGAAAAEEHIQTSPALIRQLRQQLKSLDDTVTAIEAKESKDLARKAVPRVIDALLASEAADITTTDTPVTCGKSPGSSVSASIPSRERHYPTSSKVCSNCKEIGHLRAVCRNKRRRNKVTAVTEEADDEDRVRLDPISLGEAAGLMYCIAKVSRDVNRVTRRAIPHMLHEQLEWVIKHPTSIREALRRGKLL